MSLPISSWQIDIIVSVIVVFSIVMGLRRGLLDRAIRFVSLLVVIFLAYQFHDLFIFLFKNLEFGSDAFINLLIFPIIRQILSFLTLFVILMVIRAILLFFTITLVETISEKLVVTDWINKGLGAVFSGFSSLITIYFCFVFLSLPIFSNGANLVNNSISGSIIMSVGPNVSEELASISTDLQGLLNSEGTSLDAEKMEAALQMMKVADSMGVLNQDLIESFYEANQQKIESIDSISVSQKDYDQIKKILDKYQVEGVSEKILEKLEVE